MSGEKERERAYRLSTDERWPCLVIGEPGRSEDLNTVVPERLVRRLRKAQQDLEDAENEVARWVKYSGTDLDRAAVRPIIERLPAAGERRKR